MGGPAKRHATYEDLCAVPEHLVAELIGGDLYTSPHPSLPQVRASSSLGALLGEPFDIGRVGPGGWVILDGPELHLGRDVLVPDLAGWRRERMPKLPDGAAVELAPDWVCEVQSPATAALDRARKMPVYLWAGVREPLRTPGGALRTVREPLPGARERPALRPDLCAGNVSDGAHGSCALQLRSGGPHQGRRSGRRRSHQCAPERSCIFLDTFS